MMRDSIPRPVRRACVFAAVAALAACRSPATETGATPADIRPASAAAVDTARADVRFLQDMLAHHAQALAMTALVPSHSGRRDIQLLAERIDVSQQDEIAMIRRLLQQRGMPASATDHAAHGEAHAHGGGAMPGMLSEDELARLRAARGPEFDRLFLEYMIRHHEGALTMVARLLASRGGTADTEIYRLAADVDADQRADITRMKAMLR